MRRRQREKEKENEKKGKGKEKSKREREKGEGASLAKANKINQILLLPRRTKLGSYPLPDTAQQLLCSAALQAHGGIWLPGSPLQALALATAWQTLTSHPLGGHYQPSTQSAGELHRLKKPQPKTEWLEWQPGEGSRGKGHSKPFCSSIISGSNLPPFVSQL